MKCIWFVIVCSCSVSDPHSRCPITPPSFVPSPTFSLRPRWVHRQNHSSLPPTQAPALPTPPHPHYPLGPMRSMRNTWMTCARVWLSRHCRLMVCHMHINRHTYCTCIQYMPNPYHAYINMCMRIHTTCLFCTSQLACCPSTHIPPPQPHLPTHYTQILVTAEKLTINVCSWNLIFCVNVYLVTPNWH